MMDKQIEIKRGGMVDLLNQEMNELQEGLKQKQIEEMAEDYYGYSIDLEEDCKFVATEMYDKGHRKIPENAVVLTREEYGELKQAKTLLEFREETIKLLEDANIRYAETLELKVIIKER